MRGEFDLRLFGGADFRQQEGGSFSSRVRSPIIRRLYHHTSSTLQRRAPSSSSLASLRNSSVPRVSPLTLFHQVRRKTTAPTRSLPVPPLLTCCKLSGPVDTALFRYGKSEELITSVANTHPLKRIGTVDEIASSVAFLASPESSWVNGQNILVNGVSGHARQMLVRWGS